LLLKIVSCLIFSSEFEAIAEKIFKFAALDKKAGQDNEYMDDIEVLGDYSSEGTSNC
jgi:hypothetical protein